MSLLKLMAGVLPCLTVQDKMGVIPCQLEQLISATVPHLDPSLIPVNLRVRKILRQI